MPERILPHGEHDHGFDGALQDGQRQGELSGFAAHLDGLVPVRPEKQNGHKKEGYIFPGPPGSPATVPVRCPVGVQEGGGDVALQLDDGEPQGGDGQHLGAVYRAVPLELAGGGHAELVREVAPLVVVLAVLVFVKCQGVCAVLVLVDPEFALLAQLEVAAAGTRFGQEFPPVGAVGRQQGGLREEFNTFGLPRPTIKCVHC